MPGAAPQDTTPTADDFAAYLSGAPASPPLGPPQSGAAHDTLWSSLQNSGARILNAVGYGAKDGWGARPVGLDPETQQALTKAGVFNDWKTGHENYLKSFNEAVIRPAAEWADIAVRTPGAVIGALHGGAEELAAQHDERLPAQLRGGSMASAAADILQTMQEGALPEVPELGLVGHMAHAEEAASVLAEAKAAQRVTQANEARAYGVVGEGEAGFYGAEPTTPENAQARTEAAQEAGMEEPVPPEPPAPDIHALARRVDPDTFERYDALALERQTAREELDRLASESREEQPEVIEARRDLHELIGLEPGAVARAGAFEERLQAMAASAPEGLLDRVAAVYDRLDAALNDDTPEMAAVRGRMMDADLAMREMSPEVSAAYRAANEMAPNLPEQAAKAEETPQPDEKPPEEKGAAEAEGHPVPAPDRTPEEVAGAQAAEERGLAPVAASPEAQAEVAPGSPTGEQRLGDAGESPKPTRAASPGALKPIEGTGETKVRGLAKGVEERAIEDGLIERFGHLPEYRTVQWKDQIPKAQELVESDYELAKAVAMGRRAAPEGVLPEVVFDAVERRANAEGDVATLQALGTKSRLLAGATTMGQRIAALGLRDKASPVDAIAEVQAAREAAFAKDSDIEAAKRATVDEIKAEVKRAANTPKTEAWASFLETIKC